MQDYVDLRFILLNCKNEYINTLFKLSRLRLRSMFCWSNYGRELQLFLVVVGISIYISSAHRIVWCSPILRCRCAESYSGWIKSTCDGLSLSYSKEFSKGFSAEFWLGNSRTFHIHCQKPFECRFSCMIKVKVPDKNCSLKLCFILAHFFWDIPFVFHSLFYLFLQVSSIYDEISATVKPTAFSPVIQNWKHQLIGSLYNSSPSGAKIILYLLIFLSLFQLN